MSRVRWPSSSVVCSGEMYACSCRIPSVLVRVLLSHRIVLVVRVISLSHLRRGSWLLLFLRGGGGGRGGVPTVVPCVVVPLLFACLGVAMLILAVVHNTLFLAALLLLSALALAFFRWNAAASPSNHAIIFFLDRFPASDLRSAVDGQIVKITGYEDQRKSTLLQARLGRRISFWLQSIGANYVHLLCICASSDRVWGAIE